MPKPYDCDLFCSIIDNFGDIGVSWRLARQLSEDYGFRVRLWVDQLQVFQTLCPDINPTLAIQSIGQLDVAHWTSCDFSSVQPASLVIEAFGCQLPDAFIQNMAKTQASRLKPPVWINLEYLSAESWVADYHALPSPHPRYPLTKYFFFPGFEKNTGGLLREKGLLNARAQFLADPIAISAFWQRVGFSPPSESDYCISLFSYKNLALPALLNAWRRSDTPICCHIPMGPALSMAEDFLGQKLAPYDTQTLKQLEIRVLPFLSQEDYDRLLWLSSLNFVRGEDSFVRAQWATHPLVWQIYPQAEGIHHTKLDAFLQGYVTGLSTEASSFLTALHECWNGVSTKNNIEDLWDYSQKTSVWPTLDAHAAAWVSKLTSQNDLCTSLVTFYQSKL